MPELPKAKWIFSCTLHFCIWLLCTLLDFQSQKNGNNMLFSTLCHVSYSFIKFKWRTRLKWPLFLIEKFMICKAFFPLQNMSSFDDDAAFFFHNKISMFSFLHLSVKANNFGLNAMPSIHYDFLPTPKLLHSYAIFCFRPKVWISINSGLSYSKCIVQILKQEKTKRIPNRRKPKNPTNSWQ